MQSGEQREREGRTGGDEKKEGGAERNGTTTLKELKIEKKSQSRAAEGDRPAAYAPRGLSKRRSLERKHHAGERRECEIECVAGILRLHVGDLAFGGEDRLRFAVRKVQT